MLRKSIIMIIALLVIGLTVVYAQSGDIIVQGNSFADKMAWLQAFVQSNVNYILEINANESIDSQKFEYSGKRNITITVKGIGANRTLSNGTFMVGSGIILILENNITLRGSVYIETGGNLIMNNGSTVTGKNRDYKANGVHVKGGTFTMNGGEISGNDYHGVLVEEDGTFTMNNGTISSNTSGGVMVRFGNGTYTMSGGTISGNRGSGVGMFGTGTFTMSDGTISGNTASQGGGVHITNRSTFTMSGGKISGNTATGNSGYSSNPSQGGGIYVSDTYGGTFIMNGGEISGNTATSGGGVYGNLTMNNGTISGNIASKFGGGVFIPRGCTFTMSGGIVLSNTARENGGGIYVNGSATFSKTGGTITGYTGDTVTGNAVKESSGTVRNFRGHAVYAGSTDDVLKIKDATTGQDDNLSYISTSTGYMRYSSTASGAWDN